MIIFYSGEENRSLPEYVIPNSTTMFTYFIHCQEENPSSRFRRLIESRGEEVKSIPSVSKDVKEQIKKAKEVEEPEDEFDFDTL